MGDGFKTLPGQGTSTIYIIRWSMYVYIHAAISSGVFGICRLFCAERRTAHLILAATTDKKMCAEGGIHSPRPFQFRTWRCGLQEGGSLSPALDLGDTAVLQLL